MKREGETMGVIAQDFGSEAWWLSRVAPIPEAGCWIWLGTLKAYGYGLAGRKGAHRLAYETLRGPIHSGMHVLHRCDVRCCVNPSHLFLGTNADNMADMWRKGRGRRIPPDRWRGERHHKAKLTETAVLEIRAAHARGERNADIAQRYGIKPSYVYRVRSGKTWGYVK